MQDLFRIYFRVKFVKLYIHSVGSGVGRAQWTQIWFGEQLDLHRIPAGIYILGTTTKF